MESWSDKREKSSRTTKSVIENRIQDINKVLHKLSNDEDLRDDLKLPEVIIALNHWSGKQRLQPEEAERLLEENRRVMYVLQRLQMLQSICREAQVSVPFDSFLKSRSKLTEKEMISLFGNEYLKVIKSDEEVVKSKLADTVVSQQPDPENKSTPLTIQEKSPTNDHFLIISALVTIGIGVVIAAVLFNLNYINN
mmetsp:Transcript_11181/g.16845  ORF Transcript_11181/g.16845 Transcript_11181/m.16845 type:complete len:195 (-) Transcript_11181:100-684(-)